MSLLRDRRVTALLLAVSLAACTDSKDSVGPRAHSPIAKTPASTLGTGSTSTLLGRATFGNPTGPFEIARTAGLHWSVDVKADPNFDLAVQNILFDPGGQSGWHSHPGPVFIQVVLGTMTFYEGDDPTCTPIVRTAGQGYLDRGDHPHIARNETDLHAATLVTHFAPAGAALRIDEPTQATARSDASLRRIRTRAAVAAALS